MILRGRRPPIPYCRDDERHSESYLRANVEERLRNCTDRIDLLQLHTTNTSTFSEGDFRRGYLAGDRQFAPAHPAVSTVIPGTRNEDA